MEIFVLVLIAAVPALYGLFWWLDYRWLSERRAPEVRPDDDSDDAW